MKVDAILCADIHLRDTVPTCRTDDYWSAQARKINFIGRLQNKYKCPVFCAGDVFHKAKSSPYLEGYAILNFPDHMFAIAGQHDLPNHNIDNLSKSSLGVLIASKTVNRGLQGHYDFHLRMFSYGLEIKNEIATKQDRVFVHGKVAIIHTFIQKPNDEQDKIIGGHQAKALLKKLDKFDLIVCGDNHKSFAICHEGRWLVNCGSMMRMTANQIDHKPCIWLWNAKDKTVTPQYLPIEDNVISRDHIEIKEERDARMETFISRIKDNYEIGLSFEKNLESFFDKNKTRKSIKEMVWEVVE